MGSEKKLKRKGSENRDNKDDRRKKKRKTPSSLSNENKKEGEGAAEQLRFFVDQFQAAKGFQLSSLELESLKDTCILELPSSSSDSDVKMLGKSVKAAFGASWKEVLCEGHLGDTPPGSPAVLILSSSALRSTHLLRGFRSMTQECRPVKLFSKHIKLEEQISLLKNRVNIASGTPSRLVISDPFIKEFSHQPASHWIKYLCFRFFGD